MDNILLTGKCLKLFNSCNTLFRQIREACTKPFGLQFSKFAGITHMGDKTSQEIKQIIVALYNRPGNETKASSGFAKSKYIGTFGHHCIEALTTEFTA